MSPSTKRTFADDILRAAGDEPIDAIVIGHFAGEPSGTKDRYEEKLTEYSWREKDADEYPEDSYQRIPLEVMGRPISWTIALKYLDYGYDDGFGGVDCHAVWAYTETRVIFVRGYDGATGLTWAPRSPTTGIYPWLVGGE